MFAFSRGRAVARAPHGMPASIPETSAVGHRANPAACTFARVEPVDLAASADEFDRAVAATPAIDRFCSSSAWILAASSTLMPPRAPFSFRGEHGFFAAMRGVHPAGFPYIEPVELAWGLASPLIGSDSNALVADVVTVLAQRRDWQLAIFSGLTDSGPQRKALETMLPPRWERRRGTPTLRHVASLAGGLDGFLARRPRELRKSLRKTLKLAEREGVVFETIATGDPDALYARIQDVESRSWKSRQGVGISAGPMRAFYGAMLPRLLAKSQHRLMFARKDDRDIGYIFGAVFEREYRGLQFSYDDDAARFGIGSLLQYHQVAALCDESVERYDLGTEMDYKRRWAEEIMETEMLVLVR
jgi:GNAT acetyltransferase-like protein